MIRGAIFDMDGLLLDTEAQSAECWPRAAAEQGLVVTREMLHAITGTNHDTSRRMMTEFLGPAMDFERLYARAADLIFEVMKEKGMPTRPYAREILEELQAAGVKLALATSTNRDKAEEEMRGAGLWDFFSVVCFGNEVAHGKPAPDIFLLAAERLGLAPAECAVLEDSSNGVAAGVAAGMESLWIPDQITPEERPDTAELATHVFPTLREASAHLLREI